MNPYVQHLNKIEFVITYACTGKCKHCSEGDHPLSGEHIDPDAAAQAVRDIARHYPIQTLMTFGGEPLLYPDAVCAIHAAGREMGIPRRLVITNGYFSRDAEKIAAVAARLTAHGVNSILLSVDAFHQETIPLTYVKQFAEAALAAGISVKIQPAWLVSPDADNPYNRVTRELIAQFAPMGISENEGNVIFPSGNALKYLSAYFDDEHCAEDPYVEDPRNVKTVSIEPNGCVLGGNLYRRGMLDILKDYSPEA